MVFALPSESYVDFFERELGMAMIGQTRVEFSVFDLGRKIGVGVRIDGRPRHAVQVAFEPGWEELAMSALRDWKDNP